MADIEPQLLQQLGRDGSIADTGDFAAALGVDHLLVVGVMKSLELAEMITVQVCVFVAGWLAAWQQQPGPLADHSAVHRAMPARRGSCNAWW
jgi:hypothetical protein